LAQGHSPDSSFSNTVGMASPRQAGAADDAWPNA
jgi:hypothetical protein